MRTMSQAVETPGSTRPLLLCFDGSDDAARAIEQSAGLLSERHAVVLTVCEPIAVWEPYDPGALLSAGVAKLASKRLELDEIANDLARDEVDRGVSLAVAAGFSAEGRIAHGKPWRSICEVAEQLDVAAIVVGARGLSRIKSALLGSVSSAVVTHAKRPVLVVASDP
jgi:nucleotide-binding universal stress UspA family protein